MIWQPSGLRSSAHACKHLPPPLVDLRDQPPGRHFRHEEGTMSNTCPAADLGGSATLLPLPPGLPRLRQFRTETEGMTHAAMGTHRCQLGSVYRSSSSPLRCSSRRRLMPP